MSTKGSSRKTVSAAARKRGVKQPPHKAARGKRPPKASAAPAHVKITSAAGFMAYAYAMESEAAERYAEFADSMETHNNREVAELFRKLARIEQRHADQILEEMGWKQPPVPAGGYRWEGAEGPETGDPTDLHYLMQPYHALQIALLNERRARDFFARLARISTSASVRKAALSMRDDEAEHVHLIEAWLGRTPVPDSNWEIDQDPPVLAD